MIIANTSAILTNTLVHARAKPVPQEYPTVMRPAGGGRRRMLDSLGHETATAERSL